MGSNTWDFYMGGKVEAWFELKTIYFDTMIITDCPKSLSY